MTAFGPVTLRVLPTIRQLGHGLHYDVPEHIHEIEPRVFA